MRVYLVPCLGYTCANNLEREVRRGSDSGVEAEGWDRWPSRSGAGCCHLPRHLLPLPDRRHRSPPSERVAGAPGPGFTQSRGLVGPLCFPPWGPSHASSACGRVPWPAAGLTCIAVGSGPRDGFRGTAPQISAFHQPFWYLPGSSGESFPGTGVVALSVMPAI